jgi:hypothetical protein
VSFQAELSRSYKQLYLLSSAERYGDIKHKFQDPWQLHRTEALL